MNNFEKIRALSLVEHKDGITSWLVASAPMTLKMNEIERGGYVRVGGKIKSALSVSPSGTCLRGHTLVDV